jgi:hypothetical protein
VSVGSGRNSRCCWKLTLPQSAVPVATGRAKFRHPVCRLFARRGGLVTPCFGPSRLSWPSCFHPMTAFNFLWLSSTSALARSHRHFIHASCDYVARLIAKRQEEIRAASALATCFCFAREPRAIQFRTSLVRCERALRVLARADFESISRNARAKKSGSRGQSNCAR